MRFRSYVKVLDPHAGHPLLFSRGKAMSDLERLGGRLAEDERWQSDLTSDDAQPLLDAALALLEAALAVYTPDDPAGVPYQAAYRESVAGLIREALALAARAITTPDEAVAILHYGLAPLYRALALPSDAYEKRVARLAGKLPEQSLTGAALAAALQPDSRGGRQ
ncbi:MAG TPA: hypothetical protein VHL09_16840 [Dehalococcoidia bacterium]|nr:hypothetical protein [Dehalococcoidia bacterium]